MKSLLLLLPVLLTGAAPPAGHVTFSPLTRAAYAAGRSCRDGKPRVTFPVRKQRGQLVIPTTRGNRVLTDIVVDENAPGRSEAEATTYTYRGYWPDWHCHVVEVRYYETGQWWLLTDGGQKLTLWGEPHVAPGGRHLVASCQGLEYGGGQPNRLQLLAAQPDGSLREVWRLEPKTWEPEEICWASPTTLLLRREVWTDQVHGGVYTYARLTLTDL